MQIMVLNDGETWTNLEGCTIIEVPEDFDFDDGSVKAMLQAFDLFPSIASSGIWIGDANEDSRKVRRVAKFD